ncbi:MAG: HprK-related kinase A [Chromatiales bacterium]|jgi:HprK-related kinase A
MIVSDLTSDVVHARLKQNDFRFKIGPFSIALQSPFRQVADAVHQLYADYRLLDGDQFIDFPVKVAPPGSLRRWYRPQTLFSFNQFKPFKPLPADQAFAFFEWGLNWCVASNAHQYVIIHSAVIAKNDLAIIMPGTPGSGKSTLCAAMMLSGWRLLSDEMALLNPDTLHLTPVPRPVSLKNQSIDIIGQRQPGIAFGPIAHDTAKGTVSHIAATPSCIANAETPAVPRLLILPKYKKDAATTLTPLSKATAFMEMMENTFNYHVIGKDSGELIKQLLESVACYQLSYSDLDDAMQNLENLLQEPTRG